MGGGPVQEAAEGAAPRAAAGEAQYLISFDANTTQLAEIITAVVQGLQKYAANLRPQVSMLLATIPALSSSCMECFDHCPDTSLMRFMIEVLLPLSGRPAAQEGEDRGVLLPDDKGQAAVLRCVPGA